MRRSVIGRTAGALAGTVGIYLGSLLNVPVPGAPVPQTGQTLAVLLVGLFLGPFYGPISVVTYVVLGAVGMPILAEGRSGMEAILGPSLGYLLGFVGAAFIAGVWRNGLVCNEPGSNTPGRSRSRFRVPVTCMLAMLLAHGVILFSGWLGLLRFLGPSTAYTTGVEPFLFGGLVKSLGAAAIAISVHHWVRDSDHRPSLTSLEN